MYVCMYVHARNGVQNKIRDVEALRKRIMLAWTIQRVYMHT